MGKKWFIDFFSYDHREATGVFLLVVLVLLIKWVPSLIYNDGPIHYTVTERHRIDSFLAVQEDTLTEHALMPVSWFRFDPNRLSADSFELLGLKPFLARRIEQFRSKGYRFYRPGDMLRIYDMDTAWYNKATAYIHIPGSKREREKTGRTHPKRSVDLSIDIATADSNELTRLKGIGPVLASRVIRYRNALGGFYSLAQLKEVYGIDQEKYESLLPHVYISEIIIRPIELMSADYMTLVRHPYISGKAAHAIINYRKAHPTMVLNSASLSQIIALDSITKIRIRPYLGAD